LRISSSGSNDENQGKTEMDGADRMRIKIGVDVGGTFTDFLVTGEKGDSQVFKVLSTPEDPSVGLLNGLKEIADSRGCSLKELGGIIDTIVHGTTVTTNAALTLTGSRTGLMTTNGVRDALEMRRGIREEQYNNRYTNVVPLVPRYLRFPVKGRINYCGETLEPLHPEDVQDAVGLFKQENVEAVAICFMNSFANPEHEIHAARLVRDKLPGVYLTVSSELIPAIRFYDRLSTTVLNSYVGVKLSKYLDRLKIRLEEMTFGGVLLIMQSNGGVVAPEIAKSKASLTLLSGPAAGPGAGYNYAKLHGHESCITVDMGGTSFDAALVRDGKPITVTEGEINRYRIAFPMLDIATIGAGGGSVGWIDEGGLLRMGPQRAGADPGPACYGRGGTLPTCTDADLILGYLDPGFFAGGRLKLDRDSARRAVSDNIAQPMDVSIEEAAVGMYRVINSNMAQGVREITVKRGYDPREFPMVVAGGAGPLHACMICQELEIPMFIVPRESSIFCAAGMLMSDLQHDSVRSSVSVFDRIDWHELNSTVSNLIKDADALLVQEKIPEQDRKFELYFDCRYVKQYHEVSFPVSLTAMQKADFNSITSAFHTEHNRMYGYSLEQENTPVELINVRLRAVGLTEKPRFTEDEYAGENPGTAFKSERRIYIPELQEFQTVPVYDGHKTRFGHRISGPAIIEQVNTTLFLSASFDCICDRYGSFAVYLKGRMELIEKTIQEISK